MTFLLNKSKLINFVIKGYFKLKKHFKIITSVFRPNTQNQPCLYTDSEIDSIEVDQKSKVYDQFQR